VDYVSEHVSTLRCNTRDKLLIDVDSGFVCEVCHSISGVGDVFPLLIKGYI